MMTVLNRYIALSFISFLLAPTVTISAENDPYVRIINVEAYRKRLGIAPISKPPPSPLKEGEVRVLPTPVRVAILDNGFSFANSKLGYLPESIVRLTAYYTKPKSKILTDPEYEVYRPFTAVIQQWREALGNPMRGDPFEETEHGRQVMQTIWAMAGYPTDGSLELHGFNTVNDTNFLRATQYLSEVEPPYDLVVSASNQFFGGDGTGNGSFNQAVSRVIERGTPWVNSAGNKGGEVYNDAVVPLDPKSKISWLTFPSSVASGTTSTAPLWLKIRNGLKVNETTFTLVWSGNGNQYNQNTTDNLDLYLFDRMPAEGVEPITSSEDINVSGKTLATLKENETLYPKEQLAHPLGKQDYYLMIASRSHFAKGDRLRVILESKKKSAFFVLDEPRARQEIAIPGDHPDVITVGTTHPQSSFGPTLDGRSKPELFLDMNALAFDDGTLFSLTSGGAALIGGKITAEILRRRHRPNQPKLSDKKAILNWIHSSVEQTKDRRDGTFIVNSWVDLPSR